jgi:hypothetical protein
MNYGLFKECCIFKSNMASTSIVHMNVLHTLVQLFRCQRKTVSMKNVRLELKQSHQTEARTPIYKIK